MKVSDTLQGNLASLTNEDTADIIAAIAEELAAIPETNDNSEELTTAQALVAELQAKLSDSETKYSGLQRKYIERFNAPSEESGTEEPDETPEEEPEYDPDITFDDLEKEKEDSE